MTVRLEVWRRAIVEMKRLGIEAKVDIVPSGIRLRTTDGTRMIEQTIPAIKADCGPGDPVLDTLMTAVDTIVNGPVLTVIEGGQAKRA